MVMTAHLLRDLILADKPLLNEEINIMLQDAVRESAPLSNDLLRVFLRDSRQLEKLIMMKKNIKRKECYPSN